LRASTATTTIVLLDQRGTGRSSPLACEYPEDWQEPADPMPALRKATVACLAKLGDRVRFYTTSIAVRIWMRCARRLGIRADRLVRRSYGTRVAQLYMRRFPDPHARRDLDGVTYPKQIIGVETPEDGERALNLIVARCKAIARLRRLPGSARRAGVAAQAIRRAAVMVTLDDPNDGLPSKDRLHAQHPRCRAALPVL
jgi:pimeloyl-ACP methyl ester carboxylesterase